MVSVSARVHVYVWHIIEPRKTDEQMPFGAQTRVGLRNHVSDVANTTELKRHVCGGRVAFCQITLTTYVWFSGDVAYLSWTWYGGRIIQQETGDSRRCCCCCCCTLLQLLRAVVACLSRASAAEVSSLSGDFDADSRERQRIPLSATTVYFTLNLPHTRTSFMSMDARIDYVPV